jgi:hypothetical protein
MKQKRQLQEEALVRREANVKTYQGNDDLKDKLTKAENEVAILRKKLGK